MNNQTEVPQPSIESESIKRMSVEDYGKIVVRAYELVDSEDFNLDQFTETALTSIDKVKEGVSREYVWVTVSEVLGNVVNKNMNHKQYEEYEKTKATLQGYSPEMRAFLRECVSMSDSAVAPTEAWSDSEKIKAQSTNALLMSILA